MKKNKVILIVLVTIIVLLLINLTGCNLKKNINNSTNINKTVTYNKSFGTYEVSKDWVESAKHSSSNKFYYVEKEKENNELPNNISVNMGSNKYSKQQHQQFKTAILQQLSMQINNKESIINATGSTTANGDILYTFTIKDPKVTSIQYYIVGDYKFVLVYASEYEKGNTEQIAKQIVNSFRWK